MSKIVGCVIPRHWRPSTLKKAFQLNNKLDNLTLFQIEAHAERILLTQ